MEYCAWYGTVKMGLHKWEDEDGKNEFATARAVDRNLILNANFFELNFSPSEQICRFTGLLNLKFLVRRKKHCILGFFQSSRAKRRASLNHHPFPSKILPHQKRYMTSQQEIQIFVRVFLTIFASPSYPWRWQIEHETIMPRMETTWRWVLYVAWDYLSNNHVVVSVAGSVTQTKIRYLNKQGSAVWLCEGNAESDFQVTFSRGKRYKS